LFVSVHQNYLCCAAVHKFFTRKSPQYALVAVRLSCAK